MTSIIDFDLAVNAAGADHLELGGLARLAGKGNDRDNRLVANNAGNTLFGRQGADSLIGGHGDDILRGGAGDDLITGGLGADQFEMSKGYDIVEDFAPMDGDVIGVDDSDLISLNTTSSGVLLSLRGTDHALLLQGMAMDDLSGYDIFV